MGAARVAIPWAEYNFARELGAAQLVPVSVHAVVLKAMRQFLGPVAARMDNGVGIETMVVRQSPPGRKLETRHLHMCHDPNCHRDDKRKLGIRPGRPKRIKPAMTLDEQLALTPVGRLQRKDIRRRAALAAKRASDGPASMPDPRGATPGPPLCK